MGEFENEGDFPLWIAEPAVFGRADDSGRFLGIMGGINNSLEALLYAFYVRPDPVEEGYRMGYLKSNDISGDFHSIGLFDAEGTIAETGASVQYIAYQIIQRIFF